MRNPSRRTPRLIISLLAIALLQSGLLVVSAGTADAQGGSFACDPGFYQVISGQLNEFDPATDRYTPLGSQGSKYNAIGYRPADGYLYGIQGGKLLRIDNAGGVTIVGEPDMRGGSYTGDFADDGLLHVSRGGSEWYAINVDTLEATAIPQLSGGYGVADITNVNGKFYGVSSSGTLYIFDPVSLTVTNGGAVSGLSSSGAFGAAWSTAGGNLYVGRNTGAIYQISGYSTGTPTAYQVATAQSTNSNDGASCPFAPPPPGIRDVDGAEPETPPSTPEAAAAQNNYTETYDESEQATYDIEDAGLGEGPSCGVTVNEDRLPRMAVGANQYAEGTSLYQSGFDGDGDYLILSGSWDQSGSALNQVKDCGYDYTALLRTAQVENFRFETTFRATEGVNGGGIVFNQSSEHTRSGAMVVDISNAGNAVRWGQYDAAGYYQYIAGVQIDDVGMSAVNLAVEVRGSDIVIFLNGQAIGKAQTDQPGGYVGVMTSLSKVAFERVQLTALAAA